MIESGILMRTINDYLQKNLCFGVSIKLPIMNCHGCLYRKEEWRDNNHCYMFKDKPEGNRCGQFKDNRK
jgi:hypothetical protein